MFQLLCFKPQKGLSMKMKMISWERFQPYCPDVAWFISAPLCVGVLKPFVCIFNGKSSFHTFALVAYKHKQPLPPGNGPLTQINNPNETLHWSLAHKRRWQQWHCRQCGPLLNSIHPLYSHLISFLVPLSIHLGTDKVDLQLFSSTFSSVSTSSPKGTNLTMLSLIHSVRLVFCMWLHLLNVGCVSAL